MPVSKRLPRLPLIERALIREMLATTLAVTLVFVMLFVVVTLVNVLSKAVSGDVPVSIVFQLLGLQTVRVMGLVLPLAFFIGALLAIGRWHYDNEMTVVKACGMSLARMLRPLLVLACVFALLDGLFTFYLSPLANQMAARARQENTGRFETGGIAPGVFNEVRKGEGVFFVEETDRSGNILHRVFVATVSAGQHMVVSARQAFHRVDEATGEHRLLLRDGVRYEGEPGRADYRVMTFDGYFLRVEPENRNYAARFGVEGTPTRELRERGDAQARGELHGRLARALSVIVLAVLALPLGYVRPRKGRYTGLFAAVLVYVFYTNLLGAGESLIESGEIPAGLGLWWAHLLFLALGGWLLHRRVHHRSLLPWGHP